MYSMVQIRPIIIVVIVFKLINNTSNMENFSLLVHFQAFVAVSSLEFMYTYLFYATINHTCAYCNILSRGCNSYCIFCRFVIMFYRDLLPFIVDCCASTGTKKMWIEIYIKVCVWPKRPSGCLRMTQNAHSYIQIFAYYFLWIDTIINMPVYTLYTVHVNFVY